MTDTTAVHRHTSLLSEPISGDSNTAESHKHCSTFNCCGMKAQSSHSSAEPKLKLKLKLKPIHKGQGRMVCTCRKATGSMGEADRDLGSGYESPMLHITRQQFRRVQLSKTQG